ncbi:hypothetical protein GE09DRAFT_1062914 [Coniochaeta sp. 2T2.1]|nr:hypothetical protein GE09DRAFT_1062914 [Coniochaeta sp. 2T2.1]
MIRKRVGRAIRKQKERSEQLNIQVSEEEKVVEEQELDSPRGGCEEEEEVVEEHPVPKPTTELPPPDCEEKKIIEEDHPLRTPTTEPPLAPPLASPPPLPAPAPAPPKHTSRSSRRPTPLQKHNSGWHRDKNPQAEFPWSYRQVVDEESNWRGTWTLEVREMQAMDWGIERVPKEEEGEEKGKGKGKGRGGKYVRRRTRQFPFGMGQRTLGVAVDVDAEGGQDDLMVWLGKK